MFEGGKFEQIELLPEGITFLDFRKSSDAYRENNDIKIKLRYTAEIPTFQLISWCGNFVETRSFAESH